MITVIVPAAGLSSRMGQNKFLTRFGGKSLIEREIRRLIQAFTEAKRDGKSIVVPFFGNKRDIRCF